MATTKASSLVPENLKGLLYARGFMATDRPVELPEAWLAEIVGSLWIARHPLVDMAVSEREGRSVVILGTAMLLDDMSGDLQRIAERLVEEGAIDYSRYLDASDWLCGRYALIWQSDGRMTVQSDATGMRTIYYSRSRPFVASHAHLVAVHTDARKNEFDDPSWETGDGVSYLPGVATIYEGVKQLTPNTELELRTGTVRRIFPRRELEATTVNEAVDLVLPLLKGQIAALAEKNQLALSLTAGIDSRTTLALSRSHSDRLTVFSYHLDYGRYRENPIVPIDMEIARYLSDTRSPPCHGEYLGFERGQ